jgi:hypothetical protein
MAKDKQKKAQPQRHDPLHVQISEETDFTHAPIRKQRQKFAARNNKADEDQEVHVNMQLKHGKIRSNHNVC